MREILYLLLVILGTVSVDIAYGSSAEGNEAANSPLLLSRSSTGSVKLPSTSGITRGDKNKWLSLSTRCSAGHGLQRSLGQERTEGNTGAVIEGGSDSVDSSGFVTWSSSLASSRSDSPMNIPTLMVEAGVTMDNAIDLGIEAHDVEELQFEKDISLVRQHVSDETKNALSDVENVRLQYNTQQAIKAKEALVKLAGKARKIYLYVQKQMQEREAELGDIYRGISQSSELLTEMCHYEDFEIVIGSLTTLETMLHSVIEKSFLR